MPRILAFFLASLAITTLTVASPAYATPVSPELMQRLAAFAAASEGQETRLGATMDAKLEATDSISKHTAKFEGTVRVEPTPGGEPKITVLKYVEDGVDKTVEGQKKARELVLEQKKKPSSKGDELQMPVLGEVQDKYVFEEIERSADGTRVKIQFTPKHPAQNTMEGSAWVDDATGRVLSTTFRMSKTPMFMSWLHFEVEFYAQTPLGPAPSKITIDGEGGILFLRFRMHGEAMMSDYRVAP